MKRLEEAIATAEATIEFGRHVRKWVDDMLDKGHDEESIRKMLKQRDKHLPSNIMGKDTMNQAMSYIRSRVIQKAIHGK